MRASSPSSFAADPACWWGKCQKQEEAEEASAEAVKFWSCKERRQKRRELVAEEEEEEEPRFWRPRLIF